MNKRDVLIQGSISNSWQLISVLAFYYSLLENKRFGSVSLKIQYAQHWIKKNLPEELLDYLSIYRDALYIQGSQVIDISVNYGRPFLRETVIVDDGIGAYRKNPFALLKTLVKEKSFNRKRKLNLLDVGLFLTKFLIKNVYSIGDKNHYSIFKKGIFNYFDIANDHIPFFRQAILSLEDCFDNLSLPGDQIVLFITTPCLAPSEEGEFFQKNSLVVSYIKKHYAGCSILAKSHPMDTFCYSKVGIGDCGLSNVPVEILVSHNRNKIKAVVGFASSSLLTISVLYGIPAYSVVSHKASGPSEDFWVNRAFKKYTSFIVVD